jgi:peptidoglycan/xylan/chitin deacetylase (PgdA/CDA1 family)
MKRLFSVLLVFLLLLPAAALGDEVLPTMKFYQDNYVGPTGPDTTLSVKVLISKAGSLKSPRVFELRNQRGEVLATKEYKSGAKQITFTFSATAEQEGGHDLSVWCDDQKVTAKEAYLAITDMHRKVIQKIETDQPLMCITVDCAYVGGPTDKFLEIMDKYGIKCTFFMTGQFVENFTEQAIKIRDAGHEIGSHSVSHPHMTQKGIDSWAYQVRHSAEIIRNLLGVNPRLFRPPFGEFNWKISAFARAEGMETCLWTVDSHDWDTKFARSPELIIQKRITNTSGPAKIEQGVIILFHLDGFNTASILDQMIPYYQNMGLKLVTVSELLKAGGRELPPCPYEIEEEDGLYADEAV